MELWNRIEPLLVSAYEANERHQDANWVFFKKRQFNKTLADDDNNSEVKSLVRLLSDLVQNSVQEIGMGGGAGALEMTYQWVINDESMTFVSFQWHRYVMDTPTILRAIKHWLY